MPFSYKTPERIFATPILETEKEFVNGTSMLNTKVNIF